MKLILSIIVILIISCNVIYCLEYESQLGVKGNGYLYANSNMKVAKDHVNAQGEQNYSRYYLDRNDRSLFISKYNLTEPIGKSTRIYSISSALLGSQTHFMELTSKSDINTINWVERNDKGITSRYRAATEGSLTELVTDKNSLRHPQILAETRAEGDITFATRLKSNFSSEFETDVERLLKSLDSTQIVGEVGKIDIPTKSAEISFNGKNPVLVSDGFTGKVGVGNTEATFGINPSSDLGAEDKIDTIKETAASEYRDVGVTRIIKMKENVHELVAVVSSDPSEGAVGTITTITIRLINYGKPELKYVTVTNKLPKGMTFLDSPNGTYCNGYVKWPYIGNLSGDQEIALTFRARVDSQTLDESTLNNTIRAQGATATGEIKQAEEISMFKLLPPPPMPEQDSENIIQEENETGLLNYTDEPLIIMSVGEIEVQQVSDKTEVYSGDKVTYTITIRNRGEVELTNVTMVAMSDEGINLLGGEPQKPETMGKGKLYWPNLGTLSSKGSKNLNYTVEINGSFEDATWLNNNVTVSGWAGGNLVKNDSNSMILYLKASTMREVNGYAIIKYNAPEIIERKPMVRKSTHLGQPLIWDRRAYGGWVEPREGDRYFIFDISQMPQKRSGIWYTSPNATT